MNCTDTDQFQNCKLYLTEHINNQQIMGPIFKQKMIHFSLQRTFPVSVILAQAGFSGSLSPQVPRGYSLIASEDLLSFNAFLAVGSRVVK